MNDNTTKTVNDVQTVVSLLNENQQQLLKDTINHGCWGDSEIAFTDGEYPSTGYCTNDAKRGGHFQGRQISSMFRSIYKKLCPNGGVGDIISHCSDWWGDGTGDMLFIKDGWDHAFEQWAKV